MNVVLDFINVISLDKEREREREISMEKRRK